MAFTVLQTIVFVLVGLTATAVVLTRNPKRQVFVAGLYGLLLSVLFYLVHSPDVALSELAIGSIGLPFLILFTLAKLEPRP